MKYIRRMTPSCGLVGSSFFLLNLQIRIILTTLAVIDDTVGQNSTKFYDAISKLNYWCCGRLFL